MENLLNSVESGVISSERAVDETVEMFIAVSTKSKLISNKCLISIVYIIISIPII